jgi:hypothetical protein
MAESLQQPLSSVSALVSDETLVAYALRYFADDIDDHRPQMAARVRQLADRQAATAEDPLKAACAQGSSGAAADSPPITRPDGLTGAEGRVADALVEAVEAFARLEREHPDELRDFVDGIHRCQDQLALRIVRRCYPAGWRRSPSGWRRSG